MRFKLRQIWTEHEREKRGEVGNEDYKLTYRELVKQSGVTLPSIQKIERDGNVTIETLEKLARFFGIRVSDLLDENGENQGE